ncbi:FapA family protein [Ferrimonas pelagia]|uniref:FapA family protein n=1 Tax=Ferrimonas pelagia TaxID=1177826 RepID=A0ABP9EC58_9GAMM
MSGTPTDTELLFWDATTRQLYIDLTPAEHHSLDEAALAKLLADSNYADLMPLTEQWTAALSTLQQRNNAKSHEPYRLTLAEAQDGQCQLTLSDDQMQLHAQLIAPKGGRPAQLADLLRQLQAMNIRHGLIRSNIAQLFLPPPAAPARPLIARGQAPIDGNDAQHQRLVPLAHERLLQPQSKDDSRVDLRDLGEPIIVHQGQHLMRKQPASAGQNGYDLHGKVLLAQPGQDLPLRPGNGTELSVDDPDLLIASQTGQPTATEHGMSVEPLMTLAQVDTRSGHIRYEGSVLITGSVTEGMQVSAGGDITVYGLVEGGRLKAGGDITINQGALGRQRPDGNLTCQLIADGDIHLRYCQYAQLKAKRSIHIAHQCLHSHLHSEDQIHIGAEHSNKGDLIGGLTQANKGLFVVTLGARSGAETQIKLGQSITAIKRQLEQAQHTLTDRQAQHQRLILKLNQHYSSKNAPIKAKLQCAITQCEQQLQVSQQQQEHYAQQIAENQKNAPLHIRLALLPRVNIELGGIKYTNQHERGPSRLSVVDDKLHIVPLSERAMATTSIVAS